MLVPYLLPYVNIYLTRLSTYLFVAIWIMCSKYSNFVRPTSATPNENFNGKLLNGEEAAKLYLEEIKEAKNIINVKSHYCEPDNKSTREILNNKLLDTNLFVIVQNNDIETLRDVLNKYPDKVNVTDVFGWSLLMIACQANSVEIVEELLRKGANTSIMDKAGNSAQSLVIKNKNYILANLLLNNKHLSNESSKKDKITVEVKLKEYHMCDICNKMFPDKEEHLSSTLHNISASKGKKMQPSYSIPQTNKGFQIMLKGGWDKNRGLGPDGLGKQYPIKTVQKNDKKGLGHKRKIEDPKQDTVKYKNGKILIKNYHDNKKLEIMFRREFY